MKNHRRREAGFHKQALLITLPVVILSVASLYSLRQDKAAIEQDARDRAQVLAPQLASQWGEIVGKDLKEFLVAWFLDKYAPVAAAWPEGNGIARNETPPPTSSLEQRLRTDLMLDAMPQLRGRLLNGQVQTPIDYPDLPIPPDWTTMMTSEQLKTWHAAEQAIFQEQDPRAGRTALAAMRSARVPEAACASTEFRLMLLETGRDSAPNLAQRLTGLAHKYPEACTEAGTPIADLALIQALHYSGAGPLPDPLRQELFRRVVVRPSFLTPELIAAAERAPLDPEEMRTIQLLKSTWIVQERTRTLLRTLLQHSLDHFNVSEIWLEAEGQPILADCHPEYWSLDENMIRRPPGSDYSVNLIPGRWLERAFLKAFTDTRNQLPLYATAAVQIGEKRWRVTSVSTYQDSHFPVSELASTSSAFNAFPEYVHLTPGSDMNYLAPPHSLGIKFTLTLELARPDLLYTRYRQRLWLAYGLILSAAAAAMIGLVSVWRAFKKQLRLAEMTTNFVSSVSHELRAPLASVRLMAESLEQGRIADGDKRKDYFRMIVQESRRLSSLVENVLDFSRIQQGRKRYDFEPVDLLALVRETVKLMEPNAAERQVSLILLEPESCCGELQPSWNGQAVQEALTNLIDNAIKHSPAAEAVTIELKVLARDTRTQIQLVVGDKGPGIPAGEQKKIFEPFYRAGSELRRETKGVGIGLSIVRHIAEAHGGRVLVHSVVGQGSHFTLELPLRIESKMNADKLGFQSHDNG